ncbi:S-layer homology domain-containing protein [Desulfofalx alkaliphila]|uniref:S-layer homology domain-containing protein n=1 Tax=Desulfofalx alkaliphila TaxID=105483 RepID=UPI0004E10A71|nr:S-layer homology domain-containing protein [Desulfofalx alkaliphila]
MRKIFLLFIIACMLSMAGPLAAAAEELTPGDLMALLPQGEPSDQLTRAEYAVMLSNAAGFSAMEARSPGNNTADAWYAEDLNKLLSYGIIQGYTDGTVRPDQTISRVEAVVMLSRVLGLPLLPADNIKVPGLEKHPWAAGPYTWCVKEGFLSQTANPSGIITRQEGDRLLVGAFATNNRGREINQKSQQMIKDAATMRISGKMNMIMELMPEMAQQVAGSKNNYLSFDTLMDTKFNSNQGLYQSISTSMPQLGDLTIPAINTEQYYNHEGMYMRIFDAATGQSEWIKYPSDMVPDFSTVNRNRNPIVSAELDEIFYYRVLDDVRIKGKDCYQVAFYGRINNFSQLMKMLAQDLPEVFNNELFRANQSLVDSMSFMGVSAIDKESYLPVRVNTQALITYNQKLLGEKLPFRALRTNYEFNYSDFNEPINIKLPEEVLEAKELTFN